MALYGQARDISMFRYVNRELMGNIISQQAAFYKLRLGQTNFNMYGEASTDKFYDGPILLYTLIDLPNQTQPTDDMGVTFDWKQEAFDAGFNPLIKEESINPRDSYSSLLSNLSKE